jgi:hypothetical protein
MHPMHLASPEKWLNTNNSYKHSETQAGRFPIMLFLSLLRVKFSASSVESSVRALGVPCTHVLPLLRKLHLHSVTAASDIIRLRRRLENNPHFHSDSFTNDNPHPLN